jgi:hypothetical protein
LSKLTTGLLIGLLGLSSSYSNLSSFLLSPYLSLSSFFAQHPENIVPNPGRIMFINNKIPAIEGFLTGTNPSIQHKAYSSSPSSYLSFSFLGRF